MDILPQSSQTQAQPVGNIAKEVAPAASAESIHVPDSDHESVLSPEVAHAGIRMRSDTVEIPKNVAQMGVRVVSQPTLTPTGGVPTIALPLNDEQIALGLHQSITSSFRWLAQWCEKRLKELYFWKKA